MQHLNNIKPLNPYRYYRLPIEERSLNTTLLDPLCEVFPKVVITPSPRPFILPPLQVGSCYFHRYDRAGGQQGLNAVCILGLNMINDKVRKSATAQGPASSTQVFALLWYWHLLLLLTGSLTLVSRLIQSLSSSVRYFMMKIMMYKYLTHNKHTKHIQHYIKNCSIGDWFVLYQMNRNMNKKFFAEFLALLSLKVKDTSGPAPAPAPSIAHPLANKHEPQL